MPLPEDVTLKLKHATRHLQTLNVQLGSFGERDPYSEVTEVHAHTQYEGVAQIRMKVNREPLREWSLTIGDCAHNLRAVLDYATLALWSAHSGDPSPKEIEGVQFPIYDTQRKFKINRKRRIGGIHPDAKRIIRKAQPYQRRDDPEGHPLAILAAIDNHDKHRRLHTTHAIAQDSELEILDRRNLLVTEQPSPRVGSFKDGDVIAEMRIMAIGPNPHLSVKLRTTYGVTFDEIGPGRGELVANLLNDTRLYIRDTLLVALEPYF